MRVKSYIHLLALLLWIPGGVVRAESPVRLVFLESATVPGPRITLGEIAEIQTADSALADALRNMEIALAPPPERPRDISAQSVIQRARAIRPGIEPVLDGAPTIRVWVEFSAVTPEQIDGAVREYLGRVLPETEADQEVHLDLPLQPVLAAARDLQVRVIEQSIGRPRDRFLTHVGVYNGDLLVKRITVPVSIRTFGTVVRTTRALERNAVITEADVTVSREETTTIKSDVLTSLEAAIGMRMRRSLTGGRLLYTELVETPPVVSQGDIVVLEARYGDVLVTARGKALQDGNTGDIIQVMNIVSGVKQMGRVSGPRTLIVM